MEDITKKEIRQFTTASIREGELLTKDADLGNGNSKDSSLGTGVKASDIYKFSTRAVSEGKLNRGSYILDITAESLRSYMDEIPETVPLLKDHVHLTDNIIGTAKNFRYVEATSSTSAGIDMDVYVDAVIAPNIVRNLQTRALTDVSVGFIPNVEWHDGETPDDLPIALTKSISSIFELSFVIQGAVEDAKVKPGNDLNTSIIDSLKHKQINTHMEDKVEQHLRNELGMATDEKVTLERVQKLLKDKSSLKFGDITLTEDNIEKYSLLSKEALETQNKVTEALTAEKETLLAEKESLEIKLKESKDYADIGTAFKKEITADIAKFYKLGKNEDISTEFLSACELMPFTQLKALRDQYGKDFLNSAGLSCKNCGGSEFLNSSEAEIDTVQNDEVTNESLSDTIYKGYGKSSMRYNTKKENK